MTFEAFRILAEVATGLSGFVGVILVVRSRTDPLSRLRLVGFLQNSLAVLLFSLLPEFLIATFGHPTLVMQVLCGALALYHFGIMISYLRKQRSLLAMRLVQKTVTLLCCLSWHLSWLWRQGSFLAMPEMYSTSVFYGIFA